MKRGGNVVIAACAVALGIAVPLLLAEIGLRFLPYHTGMEVMPVSAADPVLHFRPNRDVVYSKGWDFDIVSRRHVNNYGYVNDQDYDPAGGGPLLAIIGDSFIQAIHVPFERSVAGRLAQAAKGQFRVYSLAADGAPMSQYLVWADFARRSFHPQAMVISIVGNDFDESLLDVQTHKSRGPFPGMQYFALGKSLDAPLRPVLVELPARPLVDTLKQSALFSYLIRNALVAETVPALESKLKRLFAKEQAPQKVEFVGNVSATSDSGRSASSRRAVDTFLDLLPQATGLKPEQVLLTLDALRPSIYGTSYADKSLEDAEASYFAEMRRYVMAEASKRGYRVLDLQPAFLARHKATGELFEFWQGHELIDAHWNEAGNAVVAEAIGRSDLFQALLAATLR